MGTFVELRTHANFRQTVMGMNWRAYGLNQVRGQLPRGAVTLIVHLASVWVAPI